MYKVVLVDGDDFERYDGYFRYQEAIGQIEIVAIHPAHNWNNKYGSYNVDAIDNIPKNIDYFIVCDTKEYISIKNEIVKKYNIAPNRIISCIAFGHPNFIFEEYVKLIENPISIISDDCTAALMYHYLGLEFRSPFILTLFSQSDYLKVISNLKYYIEQPLIEVRDETVDYPIGIIGDVKIKFVHSKNWDDAKNKWESRATRMNYNNYLIIMRCDSEESAKKFDSIDCVNKIGFSIKDYGLKSVISCEKYYNEYYNETGYTFSAYCRAIASGNYVNNIYNHIKLLTQGITYPQLNKKSLRYLPYIYINSKKCIKYIDEWEKNQLNANDDEVMFKNIDKMDVGRFEFIKKTSQKYQRIKKDEKKINAPIQKQNVVIFNINHLGSLLPMICLRLSEYLTNPAILILPKRNIQISKPITDRLLETNVFQHVFYSDIFIGSTKNTEKEILSDIECHYNSLLNGIPTKIINQAITESDVIDTFAIYATIKNIKLTLLENRLNGFEDMNKYEALYTQKLISSEFYNLQKKYCNLCGENGKYNLIRYVDKKQIDSKEFNFENCHEKLTESEKNTILYCFGIDKNVFEGGQLLLCNSFGYISSCITQKYTLPLPQISKIYEEIHQTLLDYYGEKFTHTNIKLHPYSGKLLSNSFNNATILPGFPIEIINLMDEISIPKTISVHSSSTKCLYNKTKSSIEAEVFFYNYYFDIHKIAVSIALLKKMNFYEVNNHLECTDSALTKFSFDEIQFHNKKPLKATLTSYINNIDLRSFNVVINKPNIIPEQYKCVEIEILCMNNDTAEVFEKTSIYAVFEKTENYNLKTFKYISNMQNRNITIFTNNYLDVVKKDYQTFDEKYNLVKYYRDTKNDERDRELAQYLIEKLIHSGHDILKLEWAILAYANGHNKDIREAIHTLELYSKKGNHNATAHLYLIYNHGRGVNKDLEIANKYYILAKEQGNTWLPPQK